MNTILKDKYKLSEDCAKFLNEMIYAKITDESAINVVIDSSKIFQSKDGYNLNSNMFLYIIEVRESLKERAKKEQTSNEKSLKELEENDFSFDYYTLQYYINIL